MVVKGSKIIRLVKVNLYLFYKYLKNADWQLFEYNNSDLVELPQEKTKEFEGCSYNCCGCGCSLAIICFIIIFVVWAWHIHWLFGLLLLFVLFGIK